MESMKEELGDRSSLPNENEFGLEMGLFDGEYRLCTRHEAFAVSQ